MWKGIFSIAVVLVFAIISVFSLLHKGLLPTHDGEYHVIRFFLFNEALSDGNIYPRWANYLNNGFGVPLFNFVYPLPNYVASIMHAFSISFIDSFKLSMFMAGIIGALFFYLWAKEFWGRLGGIVSSVFYTFSPYHFVDVYIRGSVGEVWALAFFPMFLWSYTKFFKEKSMVFLIFSSISLALIVFSHNILALMFFGFVMLYSIFLILLEKEKKYLILNTLYLILLGLSLSSVFWLPAIFETKYVAGLQIFDVIRQFPELYQLIFPSWGSGFSGGGIQSELSYQIGLANLLVILLILLFLIFKKKVNNFALIIFFISCFLFVFFLMIDASAILWRTIPFMNYFQFPWRFLSLEIIFASFLAGSIIISIRNRYMKHVVAASLIFITVVLGLGYAKPAYYMDRGDNYYISRSNFIDGTNSPGNVFKTIYMKNIPKKEKEKATFIKGQGIINLTSEKSNSYEFLVSTAENSVVRANIAYFPGWTVYLNGEKAKIKIEESGTFSFLIPAGKNNVRLVFEDTHVRKLSQIISLGALFILIFLLINKRFATIK